MGSPVAFYFSACPNFAANQIVIIMEIITFESKAYKELDNKITAIADYIFNHLEAEKPDEENMWVDSYDVCTYLKISEKTLQRLRVSGTIAYSNIRGRYFYKVSEIRRMLEERLIKSNKENIDNLITNHRLYAKERGNLRKDK
ncbi:helix-turn-helix domain-containing protein [Phocaeicola dorei]|uniref:helix-turn-helix domain-containing protein n=1 Tax=Phocaeicola dorei TaxID=357276 RepID=UPI000E70776D|nr:helix-turn-helix domain-containing protein [Phocaeicola dorei]MDV7061872.1 helix-turn-helix domain-containing protein [Phocaeicola dorei]RJV59586.1 DNA-binding protein [Bacteroides sp. AF16-29]RJX08877.1 DNA-binding protein [Bacteroides sp. AF15-23LB]